MLTYCKIRTFVLIYNYDTKGVVEMKAAEQQIIELLNRSTNKESAIKAALALLETLLKEPGKTPGNPSEVV